MRVHAVLYHFNNRFDDDRKTVCATSYNRSVTSSVNQLNIDKKFLVLLQNDNPFILFSSSMLLVKIYMVYINQIIKNNLIDIKSGSFQ